MATRQSCPATNPFTSSSLRSAIVPGMLAIIVMISMLPDHCWAQRNRQRNKLRPAIGDIIEFNDFHDGWMFGMVVELNPFLKVEVPGTRSDFEQKTVTRNIEFRIVDRAQKKKKSAVRTWKSRDGKFKIEASLASVEEGKVRLKKENGKIISVPVKNLSDKDREYIERKESGGESENPFGGEEEEDYPEEVYVLIERRNELMADQELHLQLAKQNPNLMIGDIIKYETFPEGVAFGIVKSLGFHGQIETIGKNGELEDDRITHSKRWWFVDRQVAPLIARTWKSSTGKFKIEARLIDIEDDELVLEKTDGESINVPLSKLCKADETYVKRNKAKLELAKNSPLTEARENYGPDLQRLLQRRADLVEVVIDRGVVAKDISRMKSISLNTRKLDLPGKRLKPLSVRDESFSISFSIDAPEHARIDRLSYSEQSKLVAFVAGSPFKGAPTLAVANIETGDVITNRKDEYPGPDSSVLAMSPSGETLLVYSDEKFHGQQLELWNHVDGELNRINVVPYKSFWAPKAYLFSDDNGIILNGEGDLVFFDVENRIKPTHLVKGGSRHGGNHIQVSDDQRSVFYFGSGGSSLHVIDVESRKCLGGLVLGGGGSAHSSFAQLNADGETVTHIQLQKLTLFDVESGEVLQEHQLPQPISAMSSDRFGFPMLTPTLIRSFTGNLYDTELGVDIGRIEGHAHGAQYYSNSTRIIGEMDRRSGRGGFGGRLLGAGSGGATGRGSRGTRSVEVRYEQLNIDEIGAFADSLTEDDVVTFGEGDSVQLDIDVSDRRLDGELDDHIFHVMEDAGIKVVDKSDFVLEVRFSVGKPQSEKFRIIGGPTERTRNVTITPKTCYAKLKYRGQVIWSQSSSVSLGHPFSEEQLDQIIRNANSLTAQKLLEYKYPTDLRRLFPDKKRNFSWR